MHTPPASHIGRRPPRACLFTMRSQSLGIISSTRLYHRQLHRHIRRKSRRGRAVISTVSVVWLPTRRDSTQPSICSFRSHHASHAGIMCRSAVRAIKATRISYAHGTRTYSCELLDFRSARAHLFDTMPAAQHHALSARVSVVREYARAPHPQPCVERGRACSHSRCSPTRHRVGRSCRDAPARAPQRAIRVRHALSARLSLAAIAK